LENHVTPLHSEATRSRPRVVFVVGPGRSGTSAFVGVLRHLGLHVPQPEVPADDANPKGFGESRWVVDFHDHLLARAFVHVADARPQAWAATARVATAGPVRGRLNDWLNGELEQADEVVIKDPRLAWFIDLWRSSVEQCGAVPGFVTLLRSPAEVVGSRQRAYRDRLSDINKTAAWINMMIHTESNTRGFRRLFVRYEDLLDDWEREGRRAGSVLDLKAVQTASSATIRQADGYIDPTLKRVELTWEDLDVPPWLVAIADRLWQELDRLPETGGDTEEVHHAIDRLCDEYTQRYSEAEALAKSSVLSAARRATARGAAARPATAAAANHGHQDDLDAATRLAYRVPHKARALVPAKVRHGARRWLAWLLTRRRSDPVPGSDPGNTSRGGSL
jgi:hypothetical protein